jgi:PAS domain S-box-containing protein
MSSPELFAVGFENHPDPMWVYDLDSLRLLAVNDTALRKYGYAREEFLAMRISDIRPKEDIAALMDNVREETPGLGRAGVWRHLSKDGQLIHADITSQSMDWEGRPARIVCARDVSKLIALEQENLDLLRREREKSQEAEAAADHFRQLFEAVPGKFIVLTPDTFEIVAVNDDYLKATMTRREEIKGRRLFDVFPDHSDARNVDVVRSLRESLEYVSQTGQGDIMAVHRYPIRRPADHGGEFEERYWTSINSPVHGPRGTVAFIVHRVEDVTELVRSNDASDRVVLDRLGEADATFKLEMLLHSREVQAANTALLEHEASLRTAQRLLRLGLWKLDLATQRLTWSGTTYEIYGVGPRAFGHTYEDYVRLVHPDDRAAMGANYAAFVASGGTVLEFEHRIVRPDGSIRHLRGIGEKTSGPDGREKLTGVVQDVTTQREAEARVRETDMLRRIAGRVARLGAWRVVLNQQQLTWSAETAAIHVVPEGTRPTAEEAIDYYAPEYRDRIRRAYHACATEGRPFDEVAQIITARGDRIWVRAIGEPEYDAGGEIHAVRGAFQDVSEIVGARQRAAELSGRLRETLENISDGFLTLDRQWNIQFLNSKAEQLVHLSGDELIGRNLWQVFPEAIATPFQAQYERAMRDGTTVRFTEYYAPLKTWFSVNCYPTADGLAIFFTDVSERHELEERLRQALKLEAVGQLTGGVAHDFNNLLTVIMGNAELLAARIGDQPALRELVDSVMAAAESGAALIGRLLAFARRQPLKPHAVDIGGRAARMDALLQRTLGEQIEIRIGTAAETARRGGLWIAEVDPTQLENALLNLAINARDAMPQGGRLSIETSNTVLDDADADASEDLATGEYVRVAVSDTGTGMTPEVAARAFDPFYTTKPDRKGTGLGLSMVYGFVKQSGGHATIESTPGQGTTVCLYFPRAHGVERTRKTGRGLSANALTGQEHVLVVEDDEPVRQNLVTQLAGLGYRVTAVGDGPAALSVLERTADVELLFTDVVMPGGMNGRQLADAATARYPALKVLYTSGYSQNAVVHGGRVDPGVHLLSKPYRLNELATAVRSVLDSA